MGNPRVDCPLDGPRPLGRTSIRRLFGFLLPQFVEHPVEAARQRPQIVNWQVLGQKATPFVALFHHHVTDASQGIAVQRA